MPEYLIVLSRRDRVGAPNRKLLWFDDDDQAADAATRRLRLSRNVDPNARWPYDQWLIAARDGQAGWKMRRYGGVETL